MDVSTSWQKPCDLPTLPPSVAVRILALAFLHDSEGNELPPGELTGDPLRSVVPLVSKHWRALLETPEARRVLWRRVVISDPALAKGFSPTRFNAYWARNNRGGSVQELHACIRDPVPQDRLLNFASALAGLIGSTTSLRTLSLCGDLPLGQMFGQISAELPHLVHLSSLYIDGGGHASWGLGALVDELPRLPALKQLEIKFSSDKEGEGTAALEFLWTLSTLTHLSLHWPLRSALPPAGDVPHQFSELAALTTLKLRRVPLQDPSPPWLTNLRSLQHLYWDPFFPVDLAGQLPSSLSTLVQLKTLYIEMQLPLEVPASLTALEKLVIVGRGGPPQTASSSSVDQVEGGGSGSDMAWLSGMSHLVSLGLQGGGLQRLPASFCELTGLTRVGLNCNALTSEGLLPGPWLAHLQHIHLGSNCFSSFPRVLHAAHSLRTLHLANQRSRPDILQGPSFAEQRLAVGAEDVAALLALPRLEIVVTGQNQLSVPLGAQSRDFHWLQRVLRGRNPAVGPPVRLTSNELAYTMEPLDVFNVHRNGASPLLP